MGRVLVSMLVSQDGFINDPQGRVGPLYPDPAALMATPFMRQSIQGTGAVVMGRRTFEMGDPDGYAGEYEYQMPIFVLTHHPPQKQPREDGRLTFTFLDDVAEAIAQAKLAAGERDVLVVGGADVARQVLAAGLADELELGIAPVLFGDGTPLFTTLSQPLTLGQAQVSDLLGTPLLRYALNSSLRQGESHV